MTTARDLFVITMDRESDRPVGQGDLSLALAGAEVIDLVGAGALVLEGDLMVPKSGAATDDRLLDEAAAKLSDDAPYERVEDWLWRRGRDLAGAYQSDLEQSGQLVRQRRGRLSLKGERMELADSPARTRALHRWAADEPVLLALAEVVGIPVEQPEDTPAVVDEGVTTVLVAVHDAVMELEAVRQRRSIEKAAFANIWRG
ncbi:GPP34 family phosphoprotein [Streptomyces sp. NBC_00198]|uniref:GOLPH3/VPS74 family protein n=1 Tax=Streptomyces sp. NBC_00198 TaxID=2975677 RepID=UPI00225ADAB7|nr:GPP34 family phosphoprotein [Streptomyces sp. NBC_00198]MCX5280704.1 GPP34 family phosphoprotein [Streptomyces sp. NBC_00198]